MERFVHLIFGGNFVHFLETEPNSLPLAQRQLLVSTCFDSEGQHSFVINRQATRMALHTSYTDPNKLDWFSSLPLPVANKSHSWTLLRKASARVCVLRSQLA